MASEYYVENLDVTLELAREQGLRVFLEVYMDSARDGWRALSRFSLRFLERRRGKAGIVATYCLDPISRHAGS